MKYDLEERCARFGEDIVLFCKNARKNDFIKTLINQLMRYGTSIGANYMEANQASSKKDFKNKIRISQKESNETKHWLRMISVADETQKENCRMLWKEAHELTLIFAKISRNCQEKENKS